MASLARVVMTLGVILPCFEAFWEVSKLQLPQPWIFWQSTSREGLCCHPSLRVLNGEISCWILQIHSSTRSPFIFSPKNLTVHVVCIILSYSIHMIPSHQQTSVLLNAAETVGIVVHSTQSRPCLGCELWHNYLSSYEVFRHPYSASLKGIVWMHKPLHDSWETSPIYLPFHDHDWRNWHQVSLGGEIRLTKSLQT